MLQKVARQIPGVGSPKAGGFYYPRHGFGQISDGLYQAASAAGASFELGARVAEIRRAGRAWEVVLADGSVITQ